MDTALEQRWYSLLKLPLSFWEPNLSGQAYGWTVPTVFILRSHVCYAERHVGCQNMWYLPSKGITCEILDCDEDIYLPMFPFPFFPSIFKHC